MRIELARGPLDGEQLTLERHGPVFREDPREAGMFCLYQRAAYTVLRGGRMGRPPKEVPVYEFVVRLTGEEMHKALEGRPARILRAD